MLNFSLSRQTHGSIVKRALPPDNDQTRRIKKYRDLFDAFDRIDEQLGRHEESVVDDDPFNRSKRASVTSDSSRRDMPRKQHTSRDPAKSVRLAMFRLTDRSFLHLVRFAKFNAEVSYAHPRRAQDTHE